MSMSLQKLAKIWKDGQCGLLKFDVSDNLVTGAAAHVEQAHHWHEHIKHGDMTGGGDEC